MSKIHLSTAEKKFIDEVVASPSDNSLRYAYAEHLRKHSQDRSLYLQAEMKWAASKRTRVSTPLRVASEGVDSLWAARLSRPPMGSCIDHLQLVHPEDKCFNGLKPPTSKSLAVLQKQYNIKLPADYQAFLINYNGGWLKPHRISIPKFKPVDALLLYSVFDIDDTSENDFSVVWYFHLLNEWRKDEDFAERWNSELYQTFMVIGWAGVTGDLEWYCMVCRGEDVGKIYLVSPSLWPPSMSIPKHYYVAKSFSSFLHMIGPQRRQTKC